MRTFHTFASGKPPSGNPGDVSAPQWNDVHQSGHCPTTYTAGGLVPPTVDYIRADASGGPFQLALTEWSETFYGASGGFQIFAEYWAKKVDISANAISFVDPGGALLEGQPSYELSQPGQWAVFRWNGNSWDVFGGQAA